MAAKEDAGQLTEPLSNFSEAERTIKNSDGPIVVSAFGAEAPWLTPYGVGLVKIYGIRRTPDGKVEFGVGNETPPILGWVPAEAFYDEWPD